MQAHQSMINKDILEKNVSLSFSFSSMNKNETNANVRRDGVRGGPSEEDKIFTIVLTQRKIRKLFEEHSIVNLALNAKINELQRYKGWNILQKDNTEERNRRVNERGNITSQQKSGIQLTDTMQKYHDITITLNKEEYSLLSVKCVCYMIVTESDKGLKKILDKDETLELIELMNYLALKI